MSTPAATVPRHVAIIMDGNGRWAQRRGLPRAAGHRAGVKAVKAVVKHSVQRGVRTVTLFALSSENWRRPSEEVGVLMQLFIEALQREIGDLVANDIRLRFIGDRSGLSERLRESMLEAEQRSAGNTRLDINVAVSYGGRWDILSAARALASEVQQGLRTPESIDEAALAGRLSLGDQPEPDLFIRTGGDHRISNFLLWNLAYTELWFSDLLWPDFDEKAYDEAIDDYSSRERRFGLTSSQVRGAS